MGEKHWKSGTQYLCIGDAHHQVWGSQGYCKFVANADAGTIIVCYYYFTHEGRGAETGVEAARRHALLAGIGMYAGAVVVLG